MPLKLLDRGRENIVLGCAIQYFQVCQQIEKRSSTAALGQSSAELAAETKLFSYAKQQQNKLKKPRYLEHEVQLNYFHNNVNVYKNH